MGKRNYEAILLWGLKAVAVGVVIFVVYRVVGFLLPRDNWPPRNEVEEAKAIAGYKQKLAIADNPLSPRKPEDLPVFYQRIIDYDLKKGDLKSAREHIGNAFRLGIDESVEAMTQSPETKRLLLATRSANKKRDRLQKLIALYAIATKPYRNNRREEHHRRRHPPRGDGLRHPLHHRPRL